MARPNRARLAAAALVALVLLSGCAQIAVHSTVGSDGTIEEYRFQINTSRTVYGYLEQSAEDDGYDSVRDAILDDVDLDEVGAERVEYDETFRGDEVTMTVTLFGVDPAESETISITETDETLAYEDLTFVDENTTVGDQVESNVTSAIAAGFAVDYYLTMPGEIVDSNADEVDGNTAVWHESGADAFADNRIYAESRKPTVVPGPGFGVGVAVLAIALLVLGMGTLQARE